MIKIGNSWLKYKHRIMVESLFVKWILRWMIYLNWGYELVVQMADMNETHTLIQRMYKREYDVY